PRSNRNIDADSRTVAGVASDFIAAGVEPPESGTYDPEEGIELDLSNTGDDPDLEPVEEARPKTKRGGGKLGAIKLSKMPVDQISSKPESSGRFDPSEEMTEGGVSLERPSSNISHVPRAHDFEAEIGDVFDEDAVSSVTNPGAAEPTDAGSIAKSQK